MSRVNLMWIAVWLQLNERDVHATDANCSWSVVFIATFVVGKLSFSSSSCPDENAKKIIVRFRLWRSRRGENLMELRNSVWNELYTTVGLTTTKMNAHFVPRFSSCLQAVNTHRIRLVARMLVPPRDFPFLASWGMVIKISGDRRGVKLSNIIPMPFQSSGIVLRTITLPWIFAPEL